MDQIEIQQELSRAETELKELEAEMDVLRRRALRALMRLRECRRALGPMASSDPA